MSRSISAILPNYNGRHLLEKNLPSLIAALAGFEYEIIIVDDCSTDDSVNFILQSYPDITLVINKINLGFSTTCNAGIYSARNELLCIANTDVTFTKDYFEKLIDEFNDESLFAVKGDIVNYNNSFDDVISIDRTGKIYYKRGFLRISAKEPLTSKTLINNSKDNFVCLGCCFVCNREKMLSLNGFDEIYSPFYWEDIDIAQRALKKGYKLLYLPESIVYHQSSSTISTYRSNTIRRLVSTRNKFIFTWRHLDTKTLIMSHTPTVILNMLTRWLILDWKYYTSLCWAIVQKIKYYR